MIAKPDARIIYAYEMSVDGRRISTSLATVEFEPSEAGTIMIFTEQAAFLDGLADAESRRDGTETGFDRLVLELQRNVSAARCGCRRRLGAGGGHCLSMYT